MLLPKFSELIVETATQDSKTQQVASCLKPSCLQFLEMLEADDSHLSPCLGTALSSLTHDHTPFSGAACTQGLAGKGHSKTQPLFPQFRATLKRHCCYRSPHGMGWGLGLIHGIPASPSVQSCFLPCLTGIDLKGIPPSQIFLCPNLHLRVCFWGIQSETNWHMAGGGVIDGGPWDEIPDSRRVSFPPLELPGTVTL